jgi:class 3 adenylate cyclase
MATRLAAAIVLVSLASLAIATIVGIRSGSQLGRNIYRAQLTQLGGAGGYDVAAQLNAIRSATEARALSPAAADAIARFSRAIDEIDRTIQIDTNAVVAELTTAYTDRYLAPDGPTGDRVPVGELVATDVGALYLQQQYALEAVDADTGDLVPIGSAPAGRTVEVRLAADPGLLDDAGDGTDWSATHALYHPGYRRTVDELGLVDLYFIEPDQSRIVYSVGKRPDLGTSLVTGPFGGSVLAKTVGQVIDDPAAGTVMSDLSFYAAAPGRTVGVVASPVFDGDRFVGVVATMFDGAQFTEMLTVGDGVVLDASSEPVDVYLIGSDGTLRSNPRPFLADPQEFLDGSESSGLITPTQRATIETTGTAVLTQPTVGATFIAAQDGDATVAERGSMTGGQVYSTVTALPFDGVDWYVASEVGPQAAEASLGSFRDILVVGASVFVIIIAFLAVAWASRIMQPVRTISERLGSIDRDQEPLEIPDQSPVEMHHLAASFASMVATLDEQQVGLALARDERLGLLRQMLPAAVADRLANGEVDGIEQVPQASVVVLVVRGLGELVRASRAETDRDLLDRLHSELDGLAEQYGLDRIKVVGDAYFGACGHDRPFIDHAPRVVTFATDARDAVRSIGSGAGVHLDVAVGIDTGPVTVGMTGGSRLVYDVWGETVNAAHALARRAGAGDIVVSDDTHSMLPDEVSSDPSQIGDATVWTVSDSTLGSSGRPT